MEPLQQLIAQWRERQCLLQGTIAGIVWGRAADDLAAVLPQVGWQPIETAPTEQDVLTCYARTGNRRILRRARSGVWVDEMGHIYNPPSAWMPLPAPPAPQAEAGTEQP